VTSVRISGACGGRHGHHLKSMTHDVISKIRLRLSMRNAYIYVEEQSCHIRFEVTDRAPAFWTSSPQQEAHARTRTAR